jgi:glycosyltransferase involved in cell wall biosynthesis
VTAQQAEILAQLPRRKVLVVSDRYPPDVAGGAERSLHLLLREPILRDQVLVVAFDASLAAPLRRQVDGVEILALPAPAAWPLHRLTQAKLEALKKRPFGLKWAAFLRQAAGDLLADPRERGEALALHLAGRPQGGVAMDHAIIPGGRIEADLLAIIDSVKPALIHADNARSIMAAAGPAKARGVPMVALVRDHRFTSARFDQGTGPAEPAAQNWTARSANRFAAKALAFRQDRLREAAKAIATSAHLAASLRGVVKPDRLIRAALIPVEAPPEAPERRAGGGVRILLVGGLTPNKGQALLLEAFDQIAVKIPGVEIDVAGEGPDRPALERIAAGAGGAIRLHGLLGAEALAELYRDCDVVALPTLWSEPFGRVPLEAGAATRPVVAYAAGGLAETVIDGVTGRLAPIGDRAAFIEALAELAGDPARARLMGAAARKRALTHSPARLAEQLGAIWDSVEASARS